MKRRRFSDHGGSKAPHSRTHAFAVRVAVGRHGGGFYASACVGKRCRVGKGRTPTHAAQQALSRLAHSSTLLTKRRA